MTFKVVAPATIRWPVDFKYPKDNGGYEKVRFVAVWKKFTGKELEDDGKMWLERAKRIDAGDETITIEESAKSFAGKLVGWEGIVDADDKPIDFSIEALVSISNQFPDVLEALAHSFAEAQNGGGKRKNS